MSFANSPGVYERIKDKSFLVSSNGLLAGGIVVTAERGPTEINIITSASELQSHYGTPSRDNPSLQSAYRFMKRAGVLAIRRVTVDAETSQGVLKDQSELETLLTIEAANPGKWGNQIKVAFEEKVRGEPDSIFSVIVMENDVEVERFNVSRDPNEKNGYGNNVFIEDVINSRSRRIRVTDNPSISEDYDFDKVISLSGGSDDTQAPTGAELVSAWDEFSDSGTVPSKLLINAGWTTAEVQQKMLSVAESRRDAVAILDVPQSAMDNVTAMIDYSDTDLMANTHHGGLYGGWIKIFDEFNDRETYIPPSGDVAAVFVHTIDVASRWDAPAGLQRGVIPNTLGTSKNFTEGERDQLYINNINPVTTINNTATVVWGQKTLQQQASALDRFNVVNLILWVNERIKEALQPYVFEPNTLQTRESANFIVSSFLDNIQQRGGLYDFAVDTSSDINTAEVIAQNQFIMDIYIKPTKTMEMIKVNTIVTREGVSLN